MRAFFLALALSLPASAGAQVILAADKQGLLAEIGRHELYLNLTGQQTPDAKTALAAFKGRVQRSRTLAELKGVNDEFQEWKGRGRQAAQARAEASPFLFGQFGHSAKLSETKPFDWGSRLGSFGSAFDQTRLYDGNSGGAGAGKLPITGGLGSVGGKLAGTTFRADVRKISDLAGKAPPKMVNKGGEAGYQLVSSYLMEVAHRSGLYAMLTGLGVDPLPFMLSLVKSESDFRQRAVSHAGAYGFMQVLVPTAQGTLGANRAFYEELTGKKLNTKAITGQTLLDDWKMNVIAGTLFLKEQVERFDGLVKGLPTLAQQGKMLINLICGAYNAGGGGLTKFLLDKKKVTWKDLANVENNEKARAKVAAAAATPDKSIVKYKETTGYVAKIQSWYDYWRSSWASWADDRVPSSVSA